MARVPSILCYSCFVWMGSIVLPVAASADGCHITDFAWLCTVQCTNGAREASH